MSRCFYEQPGCLVSLSLVFLHTALLRLKHPLHAGTSPQSDPLPCRYRRDRVARDSVTLKPASPDWPGRSPVVPPSNFRCKHSNPHLVRRPCRLSPSPHPLCLGPAISGLLSPLQPGLRPSLPRSLLSQRSSRSIAG